MAKRRNLKKALSIVACELYAACLVEGVNQEAIYNAFTSVLDLIKRVSHTEPGNARQFYKKLREEATAQVQIVANELNKEHV
ncbi:MAG: hypothetical protein Q4E55_05175 [Bacteroidales bacterium]|nr:hypothetical protein [Bacteroidales bacterium]